MRFLAFVAMMGSVLACSSEGNERSPANEDGRGGAGTAGTTSSSGGTPATGGSAGDGTATGGSAGNGNAGGAGATDAGSGGAGGTSGATSTPVPLPEGSRERAGVVNLVDAAAAAELEAFLALSGDGLTTALNLFLTHYVEQYDFVYLFTDHELATTTAGRYVAVTHPAIAGTGWDYDVEVAGYATNGRTRGVIGIQFHELGQGPLGHEMIHHRGNFLGTEFGFGIGRDQTFGPHWGFAGFRGVLGGFDPATLHCETPATAVPPDCTAEMDGRYRYRVGSFGTSGNDVDELAPLELYLMGLLPFSELPSGITVLENAAEVAGSYDSATGTELVDASGVRTVTPASIVEKFGLVRELAQDERALTAAFVVISATPASDAVLDNVGARASRFAGRTEDAEYPSFEELTGGRATVQTTLGPRRSTDTPAPGLRIPATCDLFAQDCGANKACFFSRSGNRCGLARGALRNEPCTTGADCAPGLDCASNQAAAPETCQPYCSADDDAPNACSVQCPWYILTDDEGVDVAGLCQTP